MEPSEEAPLEAAIERLSMTLSSRRFLGPPIRLVTVPTNMDSSTYNYSNQQSSSTGSYPIERNWPDEDYLRVVSEMQRAGRPRSTELQKKYAEHMRREREKRRSIVNAQWHMKRIPYAQGCKRLERLVMEKVLFSARNDIMHDDTTLRTLSLLFVPPRTLEKYRMKIQFIDDTRWDYETSGEYFVRYLFGPSEYDELCAEASRANYWGSEEERWVILDRDYCDYRHRAAVVFNIWSAPSSWLDYVADMEAEAEQYSTIQTIEHWWLHHSVKYRHLVDDEMFAYVDNIFYQMNGTLTNLPRVQSIGQAVENFVRSCSNMYAENKDNVLEFFSANFHHLVENVKLIINLIKGSFHQVVTTLKIFSDPNLFTFIGMLLVYSVFNMLGLELVGRLALSIMASTMLVGDCQRWVSIIAWASVAWSAGRMTKGAMTNVEVNVSNQLPRVQGPFEFVSPVVVIASIVASLLLGLTTFGSSLEQYKSYAITMDSHLKIARALSGLSDSIVSTFEWVLNYMGLSEWGLSISDNEAFPSSVMAIVAELRSFDIKQRASMATTPNLCVRAEKLYTDYMQARVEFRTNRNLMQFLDRLQTPIFNLYSRACAINPKSTSNRIEPVVVMLHGESGVGKSTLLYHIGAAVLHKLGYITDAMSDEQIDEAVSNSLYARMIEQEFWDGYLAQPAVLVDDFGQRKDSMANPNEEFMELIRMSNPFPYPLHMAAVEKKDSTTFSSRVVVATTNLKVLAPTSVVSVAAIERRIDMPVKVTIRDDCADEFGRLRDEFKGQGIDTSVYLFQRWNTSTGAFTGEKFDYEHLISDLLKRMEAKQVKYDRAKQSVVAYARGLCRPRQDQLVPQTIPKSLFSETVPPVQGWLDFWQAPSEDAEIQCLEDRRDLGVQTPADVLWRSLRLDHDFEEAKSIFLERRHQLAESLRLMEVDFDAAQFLVEQELSWRRKLLTMVSACIGVMSIMFLGYSVWSGVRQAPLPAQSGKDKTPLLNKPKIEGTSAAKTEGWASQNAFDIAQLIKRNTKWIFVHGVEIPIPVLFLFDHTCVINKHYATLMKEQMARDMNLTLTFTSVGSRQGTDVKWSELYCRDYTRAGEPTDLCFLTLPYRKFTRMPNIMKNVCSRDDLGQMIGRKTILVVPNGTADQWSWHEKFGTVEDIQTREYIDMDGSIKKGVALVCSLNSALGDCGGTYLIDSPSMQRKIAGIHFAGEGGLALSVPLVLEDVELCMGRKVLCATHEEAAHELVDPIPCVAGNALFLGRMRDAPRVPAKSKLVKTKIFDQVIRSEVAPAKLSARLETTSPLGKGIAKQFGDVPLLDKSVLDAATHGYENMLSKFTVAADDMTVLSFDTAVQGELGSDFIRGINRARSAGYPWSNVSKKGKTHWFGSHEWDLGGPNAEEVRRTVMEQIDRLQRGLQVNYIFVDTLKDETRPVEKVQQGKTRVFAAAPMDFIIIFRMYFLKFIAHMMKNRIRNESAVGIRAQSCEWHLLATHLMAKGNHMIAGDFSNYDGSLHPEILWAIYDIIERFYQGGSQYSHRDAVVRRLLWENLVNSKHLVGDFLYQLNHSQPSGNPATAVLNSMYNSLSMRYVFHLLDVTEKRRFEDYVSMVAYGDDNVLGVSPHVHAWFNQETITNAYATIGMTYTDEEKTGQMVGFKRLEKCLFLKRGFVFDEVSNFWIAPLKLSSILECFNWIQATEDERLVMRQNAEMAYAELALHPQDAFSFWTLKIRRALISGYKLHVPENVWEQYRLWLRDGTFLQRFPDLQWA